MELIVLEEAFTIHLSVIYSHTAAGSVIPDFWGGNRNVYLSRHCGFNPCNPAFGYIYCWGVVVGI